MRRERVFLYPAKGHRIRKQTNPLLFVKPEGEILPLTIYYQRRIRRGELLLKIIKGKKKAEEKKEKNKI